MNKCHVPITWVNDQTPAINDTHLNQYDGELDTLDDRIITLDGTKALQSDLLLAFKDVSLNSSTGVITFTLFNNTTKTIDTLLEKVAINFDYDDDPTSPHYQNLIIELEDGTYKYIDMSALITEYEFDTSSTIAFTVANDGTVTADVIDGSITSSKLDPALATPIANAEANGLKSEGFAVGEQNGVPVTSGSPYYQNNAKYYKEQAAAIVNMSFSGLSDTDFNNLQDGQIAVYDANSGEWINSTPVQTLSGLTDTTITTPSDGEVLTYDDNSNKWVNSSPPTPTTTLAALTDTDITNPQDGEFLVYDGNASKWVNAPKWRTFATATEAELLEMVRLADSGILDLYEDCGWRVGQERQVLLSAINASGTYDGVTWGVSESQAAQTITLVLLHKGTYELVDSVLDKQGQTRTTCSFVVGMKDCMDTRGYINSTNTNSGSWNGSARRNWCNGGFRGALNATYQEVFKKFKTKTIATYNGSTIQTSEDWFALAAEKELFGAATNSNATEADALTQFTYYETSANRVKKVAGTAGGYWGRSPYATNATQFCRISGTGTTNVDHANSTYGISVFGCI